MDISEPCPIVQPQFKPLQTEHYKTSRAALPPALAWAAKSQRRCHRIPNTNQCLSHLGVFILNVHKTEHRFLTEGLGNKVKVTMTHVQSLCIYDGQAMLSHTLISTASSDSKSQISIGLSRGESLTVTMPSEFPRPYRAWLHTHGDQGLPVSFQVKVFL